MNKGPQKPQYISPAEIAARRQARRIRRRANRRMIKAHVAADVAKIWPYTVKLQSSVRQEDRSAIRRWMLEQQMRKYDPEIDNREKADVIFDEKWQVFHFAREEHSVLFNLCFS